MYGVRDRALNGLMCLTSVHMSAVAGVKVEDYYQNGRRWIRFERPLHI